MTDKLFKKYNLIVGWAVFAIALLTYSLTVEPTVSFWDCGEYIATSAKLEVGHPPGAPFFQMMGAFIGAFKCIYSFLPLLYHRQSCKKDSLAQCQYPISGSYDSCNG